jgi:hypothetical protein
VEGKRYIRGMRVMAKMEARGREQDARRRNEGALGQKTGGNDCLHSYFTCSDDMFAGPTT